MKNYIQNLFLALTLLAGSHQAAASILLSDNFDSNSIDVAKWATNTSWEVNYCHPRVIAINQRIEFTERGYLNTVTNYDPSALGGLLITGTWTILNNGGSGDAPTVATRSSGIPLLYNVGSGEVADGIRFKLQPPQNNFQLLILGTGGASVTGYNQVSNTLSLVPGDTVNFTITDDGTNLTFSATKVGNPTNSAYATAISTSHLAANKISFYNRETSSASSALDNVVVSTLSLPAAAQTNAPFAYTEPASLVTGGTASLNGMATPNLLPSAAWFQWGATRSYGNQSTPASIGSGSSVVWVTNQISGLTTGLTYHFQLVVSNSLGVVYGADQMFGVGKMVAWGTDGGGVLSLLPNLTNIVAISAGYVHGLAIKSDGKVVGWGDNQQFERNVPSNLSNAVAIAASGSLNANFSLAIKSDGSVTGWGDNSFGQLNVPALTNAVAIAAGSGDGLALKKDGTIAVWGYSANGETSVPTGLSNVVAIAEGADYSLALKNDGTVVTWGYSAYTNIVSRGLSNIVGVAAGWSGGGGLLKSDGTSAGWGDAANGATNSPAGVTNLILLASGNNSFLALNSNGVVKCWGRNDYNQTNVPAGLSNVVAVAAGYFFNLVLESQSVVSTNSQSVLLTNITVSPVNPTIGLGSNLQFTATEQFNNGASLAITNGGTNSLWSSSNPSVATITTNGMATGLTNGTTTITATVGGIFGSTSLVITSAPAIFGQSNQFLFSGIITNITLPPGTYNITAYGAQGGNSYAAGGFGAEMEASFYFPTSTTLILLVGGAGSAGYGAGGGGGTFVVVGSTPLVIGGGGGGGGYGVGQNGEVGRTNSTGGGFYGGTGGNGGGGSSSGGGGGFYGNGGNGGGYGGSSFLNNGAGGSGSGGIQPGGNGGYGGGGGGGGGNLSGGGGGGYSGGSGSGAAGAGGGSFIDSSAIGIGIEMAGVRSGNGEIDIVAIGNSGPILTNIIVSPTSPTITVSSNQQFTATGFYNDGSTQILTSNLTWNSSSPTVATITTNGLATGLTVGTTTIKAISGTVSNTAILTVLAFPVISLQPTNNAVSPNGSVTLTVSATGGNLGYQWRFNGTNISGATSSSFTITNVASTNVGVYTVVVSNLAGSVTSRAAIVGTTAITMYAGVIVNGPLGSNYLIQAGSNLGTPTNWMTLTNIALPTQPYIFIDYSTPFNSQQFYRAMPQ